MKNNDISLESLKTLNNDEILRLFVDTLKRFYSEESIDKFLIRFAINDLRGKTNNEQLIGLSYILVRVLTIYLGMNVELSIDKRKDIAKALDILDYLKYMDTSGNLNSNLLWSNILLDVMPVLYENKILEKVTEDI